MEIEIEITRKEQETNYCINKAEQSFMFKIVCLKINWEKQEHFSTTFSSKTHIPPPLKDNFGILKGQW